MKIIISALLISIGVTIMPIGSILETLLSASLISLGSIILAWGFENK